MPTVSGSRTAAPPALVATDDPRWRGVEATMRRHGYAANALIETLHSVQDALGCLDDDSLIRVARSLKLPLSKVYGVATFYNVFRLRHLGEHICIVCTGTTCHIKGGPKILAAVEQRAGIAASETTPDGRISLEVARCVGACGMAPVVEFDGQEFGDATPADAVARIEEWISHGR